MKTLQECSWKEFRTIDIFSEINIGKSYDLNRLHITGKNGTNYVCRSSQDNGIQCEISDNIESNMGNCITIAMVGECGTSFYQDARFVCSQNILILRTKQLNRYNGLFLCRIIELEKPRFSYGRTLTKKWFENARMYLPATPDGTPDWQFMEDYMREVEKKLLSQALPILQERISNYKNTSGGVKIDKQNWKEFAITDIFCISSGVRLTTADMCIGDKPFVGASDSNNGITAWVSNTNASLDKDVLGVNYNGSVCETFYHPYKCLFSDDVKRLHYKQQNLSKDSSKYIYLFLKQAILQQKTKYAYGYKFNAQRMSRQTILLPTTPAGTPDYDFMEAYMREVEYKQLLNYVATKNRAVR